MTEQLSRRDVNRALLAAALSLAAPGAVISATRRATPLFDFAIAGGSHHGLLAVRDALVAGERLILQAEPTNPHDPNAIAVRRGDGLMLGYVPRAANEPIARLLARGSRVEAVVVEPLRIRFGDSSEPDFVFTAYADGDPRIRLTLLGEPSQPPSSHPAAVSVSADSTPT